jgi:hypothetical protein
MILRSSRLSEGQTVEELNGKLILTNTINVDPYLQNAYELRKEDRNGWAEDKSIRKIASVPFTVWNQWCKQFPELIAGDKELREKTLNKLLRSEEGSPFCTVRKGI